MQFLDYKNKVEQILAHKKMHLSIDMNDMFEAYINSVTPVNYIKSMLTTLNESSQNNQFTKYYQKVIDYAAKRGYRILKMPAELNEEVINFYNDGYNAVTAGNYITEQIKKNTIKPDKSIIEPELLKNKLLLLIHSVDDCALQNIEVNKNEAKAILKIKIFDMRNEISTDIKSYIRELHKHFVIYLRQNIDNNSRLEILGYNIVGRSVFVTIKMKIDFIENEETNTFNFSAPETLSLIQLYINIFRTFAEQYRALV